MRERLTMCVVAAGNGDPDGAALLAAGVPHASGRLSAVAWLSSAAAALDGDLDATTPGGRVAGLIVRAVRAGDPVVGDLLRAVVGMPDQAFGAVASAIATACASRLSEVTVAAVDEIFCEVDTVPAPTAYFAWVDRRHRLLADADNATLALAAAATTSVGEAALDDLIRLVVAGSPPYSAVVEEIADGLASLAGGLLEEASRCGFSPEPVRDLAGVSVALRLAHAACSGDARTLWGLRAAFLGSDDDESCLELLHAQATLVAHLVTSVAEIDEVAWLDVLEDQVTYPLDSSVTDGPATARHRAGLAVEAAMASDTHAASRLSRNLLGDDPTRRGACAVLCDAFLDVSAGVGRSPTDALGWLRERFGDLDVAAERLEATIEHRPQTVPPPAVEVGAVLQLGVAVAAVVSEAAEKAGQDPAEVAARVLDERAASAW